MREGVLHLDPVTAGISITDGRQSSAGFTGNSTRPWRLPSNGTAYRAPDAPTASGAGETAGSLPSPGNSGGTWSNGPVAWPRPDAGAVNGNGNIHDKSGPEVI